MPDHNNPICIFSIYLSQTLFINNSISNFSVDLSSYNKIYIITV